MTRTQNCGKCKLPKSLCPCGRPTKLNEEIILKLKEAATWDCTVAEMCLHAGISESSYYLWAEKYPEFSEEINRLRENPVLTARQTVVGALKTDKAAAFTYLSRKKRSEFGESVKVDMNTSGAVLISSDPAVIAAENAVRQQAEEALRGIMLNNPPKQ